MPRIAAVIVTCNRLEKLKQTIEKTLAQPFSHVVVVDNASTDGTQDYLRMLGHDRLIIEHEAANLGGAGGFARGFAIAAHQTDAEWLVCFDDDAYPAQGALEAFAALALAENVGGVAAAVYFPDGRICSMNRPGTGTLDFAQMLEHLFAKKNSAVGLDYSIYQARRPTEVGFSSFVGFFVRCALVRGALGLPQADLFIYRDDSIYTLALTKLGHKLLFAPDVRFVHDCKTPVAGPRVYVPLWKAYYVIRNDLPFFKSYSGGYFYLILPALLGRWLVQTRHYPRKLQFLKIALVAMKDGLTGDFSRSHQEIEALAAD